MEDFDPVAYINEPRWRKVSLGLDRTRLLLDLLGRPQDSLRFVHVAGTNGKGSTSKFMASALQEAGFRTGLYTSPYIETFEDRIQVDGQNIPADDLMSATLDVREAAAKVEARLGEHPTEFELMTAVGMLHFARRGCDIVVLEVGMGGRLDSTNAIDAPEAAVITRLGLDHTAVLGDTIEAIAGEKAGIIKDGSPVVSWPQVPEAAAVIERAAAEHHTTLREPDFSQLSSGSVQWDAEGGAARPFVYRGSSYQTRLLGSYQPANAALAIEALDVLRGLGWEIPEEAQRRGISQASWPGRFEIVDGGGEGRPTILVDGGHNPQGARALVDSLGDVFPGVRPVFVVGFLADKDYRTMVRTLLPVGSAFVTVSPESPRALSAQDLAEEFRRAAAELPAGSEEAKAAAQAPVVAADGMPDAVARARELAGGDGLICGCGSLYDVAAFKKAL